MERHRTLTLAVALLLWMIAGCSTIPTARQFGTIDGADMRMTVPTGGDQYLGPLKERLIEFGWDIKVHSIEAQVTTQMETIAVTMEQLASRCTLME